MKCLITGTAGFIGSHLAKRLLQEGHKVIGIDNLNDYYPKWIKQENLKPLLAHKNYSFIEKDLNDVNHTLLIKNKDIVFHLAAQAGVRASWGENFSIYTRNNIDVTQKLLEAARRLDIQKFIYASSSSVYGLNPDLPWSENGAVLPFSPYGVSKLAAEQLCSLYYSNFGVPALSLRLFTVYGQGQRPDMAFHRFFKAIAEKKPISIFGNGEQTRDFTYVADIVQAKISAMNNGKAGEIYNIGGGHRRKLNDVLFLLREITQREFEIKKEMSKKGDVPDTYANIEKAKKDLFYKPEFELKDGLLAEWEWIQSLYNV